MQPGEVWRYVSKGLNRERHVVVVSPAAINDSPGYGWVLALEVVGEEPEGLLAVEVPAFGWVTPRHLDALYKTSFQEEVGAVDADTMERIHRLLRVALDL